MMQNDLLYIYNYYCYLIWIYVIVDPIEIVLGTKLKTHKRGSKRCVLEIAETMMYIPVLESLQLLLRNTTLWEEVSIINYLQWLFLQDCIQNKICYIFIWNWAVMYGYLQLLKLN